MNGAISLDSDPGHGVELTSDIEQELPYREGTRIQVCRKMNDSHKKS